MVKLVLEPLDPEIRLISEPDPKFVSPDPIVILPLVLAARIIEEPPPVGLLTDGTEELLVEMVDDVNVPAAVPKSILQSVARAFVGVMPAT
jgi:hypothetical protein